MLSAGATSAGGVVRPIIGIVITWTETMPCNYNLRQLAARVTQGCARQAARRWSPGGQSGEQVWESVKGQFISAWNVAMSGTAVAGAMGGACNSGSTPR